MSRYLIAPILVALASLTLDQISKAIVVGLIPVHGQASVLPFFDVVHVLNRGAAFSFLADQTGWQRWLFTFLGLAISTLLMFLIFRKPRSPYAFAHALIVGGALGNVVDRLSRGAVIDWIDFYIGSHHWPAFNLADTAIFCGVAMLLYQSLFEHDPSV